MTMGTRVAIMRDGVVQQHGRPIDVFNNPANVFVAGFMGELKMNFLTADLVAGDGRLAVRGDDFGFALEGRALAAAQAAPHAKVVLGVRPEHISAAHDGGEGLIKGRVVTFEIMGSRALLTVARDRGGVMSAEVPSGRTYDPGMEVSLRMDWSGVHVFDADSERALGGSHA